MLCGSNIVIYAAEPSDTRCLAFASRSDAAIATVSRIEVLGFPGFGRLSRERQIQLVEIVESIAEISLIEDIIQQAVLLRQQKKMSLGDSIIAATALLSGLPLVTRNVGDFQHISELRLINPFDPA
jgi:toxin FitB